MKISLLLAITLVTLLAGCGTSGPGTLEWSYTGGPFGQNVAAILADDKVPGQIFAALLNGEVYVSPDEGKTWKVLSTIRKWDFTYQLVQDPDNGDLLYASTEKGLFISKDRGHTWSQSGPARDEIIACRVLAVDPWKTSNLYLGTGAQGIYKSTDGGLTWLARNGNADSSLATAEVFDLKMDGKSPDAAYAAVWGAGILKTVDGGANWQHITPNVTPSTPAVTHLLLHPKSPGMIVYATETGTFVRTTDGGLNWSVTKKEDDAWRVLTLTPDPLNSDILYAGTESGLLRSTDFGGSWSRLPATIPVLPTSATPVRGTGPVKLFAFGAGLGVQATSDNGGSWEKADNNLGGATISLVGTDPSGESVYAASEGALLRFDAATQSWTPACSGLSGGDVSSLAFDPDNSSVMYTTSTGGAFKSTNGGDTWTPIARNVRMSPRFIDTHPSIKTRMVASGVQGAFVSTDRGNSWFLTKPMGNKFAFHRLTYTPKNAGIVHAATLNQGVLVTNDGGLRWEPAKYGLPGDTILAVTLDDQETATYFAWTPHGDCFRSTNSGLEWSRYTPPWPAGSSLVVAFDRVQPSSVVAIANGEDIYYSPSGGTSWFRLVEKGTRFDVLSAHWNLRSGILYIGTREKGVYRIVLGPTIKAMLEE
jgi:photosystem II stability/assembly factor-like uncharacterized protein